MRITGNLTRAEQFIDKAESQLELTERFLRNIRYMVGMEKYIMSCIYADDIEIITVAGKEPSIDIIVADSKVKTEDIKYYITIGSGDKVYVYLFDPEPRHTRHIDFYIQGQLLYDIVDDGDIVSVIAPTISKFSDKICSDEKIAMQFLEQNRYNVIKLLKYKGMLGPADEILTVGKIRT